jgi:hypothetical protein
VIAPVGNCVLDEAGAIVLEQRLGTTPKAMKEVFGGMPAASLWKRYAFALGQSVASLGTK